MPIVIPTEPVPELMNSLSAAAVRFAARGQTRNSLTCTDLAAQLRRENAFRSQAQYNYALNLIRWSMPRQPVMTTPLVPPTRQAAVAAERVAEERLNAQETAAGINQRAAERTINPDVVVAEAALQRIQLLFNTAHAHGIQRPRITLQGLQMSLATGLGREGQVYVRSNHRSRADRRFYGVIHQDGRFVASSQCGPQTMETLREFGDDPLRIARAYGHATGACCFCRRTLTDARSVAMGYGPVCARRFGLEWGEQRASSVVDLTNAIPVVSNADVPEAARAAMRAVDIAEANRERALRLRRLVAPRRPREEAPLRPANPLPDDDEDSHFM